MNWKAKAAAAVLEDRAPNSRRLNLEIVFLGGMGIVSGVLIEMSSLHFWVGGEGIVLRGPRVAGWGLTAGRRVRCVRFQK